MHLIRLYFFGNQLKVLSISISLLKQNELRDVELCGMTLIQFLSTGFSKFLKYKFCVTNDDPTKTVNFPFASTFVNPNKLKNETFRII